MRPEDWLLVGMVILIALGAVFVNELISYKGDEDDR
jgi:cell division septation protein DedD